MDIRIIGAGKMGEAIGKRLSAKHHISFFDRYTEKAKQASMFCGGQCVDDPFANSFDLWILAIKPQDFESFSAHAKDPGKPLISILSGTSISKIRPHFPSSSIIRMVPNLAVACGDGVIALSSDQGEDKKLTELFSPLGLVKWMPEEKINAVTALAGSGPGFMSSITEAMVDAGIAMGLSKEEAFEIVKQMIKGSVSLLDHKFPAELKWEVTSPAGTTIEGLRKFEQAAVRSGLIETFLAAFRKAQELG